MFIFINIKVVSSGWVIVRILPSRWHIVSTLPHTLVLIVEVWEGLGCIGMDPIAQLVSRFQHRNDRS